MSLELVNTFGTLLTVAIIAATAIAAMVQLRHLRAGNQINAMLSIGNQYDHREFREAQQLLPRKLASTLEDPLYREYELAISRNQPPPAVPDDYVQLRSAANLVGNTHEELGILVKNGIVDKNLFLIDIVGSSPETGADWNALPPMLAPLPATRAYGRASNTSRYLSEDWMREHPSMYPKGMRRLQLHNPWPVPPMSATA